MSLPWSDPEADPLRDIQEFMREAERQVRTSYDDMSWVIAPNLRHAMAWAYRNGVPPWQWQYLNSPAGLSGLHAGTVVVVNGGWPGDPGPWEAHLHVLEATGVTVSRAST